MHNQDHKTKARTMTSIMNHPKLSKIFSEACDAPIGSTKRKQARGIISIMNKVYGRNALDGTGGLGDPMLAGWSMSPSGAIMQPQSQVGMPSAPPVPPKPPAIDRVVIPAAPRKRPVIYAPPPPKKYQGIIPALAQNLPGEVGRRLMRGRGILPAIGGVLGGGLAATTGLLEAGVKSAGPLLFTGYDDPSELTSWGETKGAQAARDLYATVPWYKKPAPAATSAYASPGAAKAAEIRAARTTSTSTPASYAGAQEIGTPTTGAPSAETGADPWAANWTKSGGATTGATTGYGGEIVPTIQNKKIDELTPQEKLALYAAQKTREGSTLDNNPFGIKLGPATQHWYDEGKAVLGSKATDGGQFLVFKDENTANQAYDELLYGGVYSGLTVDEAMKKWSGYGIAPSTQPTAPKRPGTPASVQAAVDRGVGPYGFALNTMADKEALKALFPGVPEDQLPMGASLSGQIAMLHDTVKKELNLDSVENELARKTQMGVTIKDDLAGYVASRDKMLNAVDGMISDFENKIPQMNLADPGNAANARNYMNYLLVMKGRAAQRYQNMVDQSVNVYSAELQGLTSLYEERMNEFNTVYNQRGTIAQEQYNNVFAGLTDLYNRVEDAPRKAYEMEAMRINVDTAKIANDVALKAAGVTDSFYDSEKYAKNKKIIENELIDEKTGILKPKTLEEFMREYVGRVDMPPAAIWNAYLDVMNDELQQAKTANNMTEYNTILDLMDTAATSNIAKELGAAAPGSAIQESYNRGMALVHGAKQSFVTQNAALLKAAIEEIFHNPWWGRRDKTIQDKKTWVDKYTSSELPATFLNKLYDRIALIVNNSSDNNGLVNLYGGTVDGTEYKGLVNEPDDVFIEGITKYIK